MFERFIGNRELAVEGQSTSEYSFLEGGGYRPELADAAVSKISSFEEEYILPEWKWNENNKLGNETYFLRLQQVVKLLKEQANNVNPFLEWYEEMRKVQHELARLRAANVCNNSLIAITKRRLMTIKKQESKLLLNESDYEAWEERRHMVLRRLDIFARELDEQDDTGEYLDLLEQTGHLEVMLRAIRLGPDCIAPLPAPSEPSEPTDMWRISVN